MEGVRVEDGLDHDERLSEVLPDKVVPVVGRLVRAVVEHLQEGRPPQVEHELRERWREEGYQHDGTLPLEEEKINKGKGFLVHSPEGRETETLTV